MTLRYDEIYSIFLSKIEDFSFLENNESLVYESMKGWLHSAASNPRIRAKFSSFSFDDELMNLDCELKNSVDSESDTHFVSEVLAKGMVIEWLEPQVKSVLNMKQFFGGKEEKLKAFIAWTLHSSLCLETA